MMSRRTARAVLPPLFALGLVALVVRPLDAAVGQPAVPGLASTAVARTVAAPASPSVAVAVGPVVAFTDDVTVSDGRLRTPVLVDASAPAGTAMVVGLPGCDVAARPGVVAWLDCAYPDRPGRLTVRVELTGGVVYTHTVEPIRR